MPQSFTFWKMYLTRAYKSFAETDDFSNAATTFDLLVENPASGYALQENYAALFDENNQANSEVIWAIQYGLDKNYRGMEIRNRHSSDLIL